MTVHYTVVIKTGLENSLQATFAEKCLSATAKMTKIDMVRNHNHSLGASLWFKKASILTT